MSRVFSAVRWLVPSVCLLLILGALGAQPVLAAGTVGNGTSASCTESAFITALAGGGKVKFNCGSAEKTIVLTATYHIVANTTIDGGNKILLKAQNINHFHLAATYTLNLKNITLTKGQAAVAGAVENYGTLKTNNVKFHKNRSTGNGGAINNYGDLELKNTIFVKNVADGQGGAIYNGAGGQVSIRSGTFLGNKAVTNNAGGGAINNHNGILSIAKSKFLKNKSFNGGAVQNEANFASLENTFDSNVAANGGGAIMNLNGTSTLGNTTVKGNTAGYGGGAVIYGTNNQIAASTFNDNTSTSDGGGIFSSGNILMVNVTLSGNKVLTAGHGGGGFYHNAFIANIYFITVADNTAPFGAGIYQNTPSTGTLNIQDSVLSHNTGGNCAGTISSMGYNLSSDTYCSAFTQTGDKTNKNPKLGPLANNGGPTQTHKPQTGSPLINKGTAVGGVTTDQRGVSRSLGGKPDIGSVEAQ